jgi:hypothetical protein
MRVLFDQATPVPLRPFLTDHTVRTAAQQHWDTLRNGDLLTAAEEAGFEVLLTTDRNMRYQQNLTGRTIAIVVIGHPQWPIPPYRIQRVVAAVNAATAGSYTEVDLALAGVGGLVGGFRRGSDGGAPWLLELRPWQRARRAVKPSTESQARIGLCRLQE